LKTSLASSSVACAELYTFCDEQRLQRYLSEFQFRYNNRSGLGVSDGERTAIALKVSRASA
jgi:hypothetical protein